MEHILFVLVGFITGSIDGIVGGGGLISLPFLSLKLGAGPMAVGTNKILGTTGAIVSFLVYLKAGHFKNLHPKKIIIFMVMIFIGSTIGSSLGTHINELFIKILLLIAVPFVLYVVWNKNSVFKEVLHEQTEIPMLVQKKQTLLLIGAGFFSGFYDGIFGPGGGTVMFLSLSLVVKLPILAAIAVSKLANSISATTALVVYAKNDLINYKIGLLMAIGMIAGSFLSARFASKNVEKIIRPLLTIIVALLVIKILFM